MLKREKKLIEAVRSAHTQLTKFPKRKPKETIKVTKELLQEVIEFYERVEKEDAPIKIEVWSGLVDVVENIPEGLEVEVLDFDVETAEDVDRLPTQKGFPYVRTVYGSA